METQLGEAQAALSRMAAGTSEDGDIRAPRVVIGRLEARSNPPADDVREVLAAARNVEHYLDMLALDVTNPVRVVIDESFDGDGVIQSLGVPDLRTLVAFVREVRPRETVTPPADDVREALALTIDPNALEVVAYPWPLNAADRVLERFEVLLRGTVTAEPTDAQVLAGLNAELPASSAAPSLDYYGPSNIARMRNILAASQRANA
ncbi:hypothetical protein [Microbacterium enclense]|uniref:hypothetical protein n=1 Tax=Microbacterium enclense TaxID=993073 RepID=UPI003F812448